MPGLGNCQIPEQFYLSPFTVKTYANRTMAKLGPGTVPQLITLAIRAGIHLW